MTTLESDQLLQLEQRLNQRLDGLAQAIDALTRRFDTTESQVADMHLVHQRIKRTEAAYTRYHRGGGGPLLPGVDYELDESGGDDDDDESGVWRPGNIGPVTNGPIKYDPLHNCCAIQ